MAVAVARLTNSHFERVFAMLNALDPDGEVEGWNTLAACVVLWQLGHIPAIVPSSDLDMIVEMKTLLMHFDPCILVGNNKAGEQDAHAVFFDGEYIINDSDTRLNEVDMTVDYVIVTVKRPLRPTSRKI
jgi:hypothetical protein